MATLFFLSQGSAEGLNMGHREREAGLDVGHREENPKIPSTKEALNWQGGAPRTESSFMGPL